MGQRGLWGREYQTEPCPYLFSWQTPPGSLGWVLLVLSGVSAASRSPSLKKASAPLTKHTTETVSTAGGCKGSLWLIAVYLVPAASSWYPVHQHNSSMVASNHKGHPGRKIILKERQRKMKPSKHELNKERGVALAGPAQHGEWHSYRHCALKVLAARGESRATCIMLQLPFASQFSLLCAHKFTLSLTKLTGINHATSAAGHISQNRFGKGWGAVNTSNPMKDFITPTNR